MEPISRDDITTMAWRVAGMVRLVYHDGSSATVVARLKDEPLHAAQSRVRRWRAERGADALVILIQAVDGSERMMWEISW